MKSINDKAQLLDRAAALRRFNDWEAKQPREIGEEKALAGVGALYDLIPPEFRQRVFDPSGLRAMRRALSYLKGCS